MNRLGPIDHKLEQAQRAALVVRILKQPTKHKLLQTRRRLEIEWWPVIIVAVAAVVTYFHPGPIYWVKP